MGKRGLRSIGIRKVTPNQIDFRRPISGSISFHQTTTPDTVNSGLGNLYIKSDGKLYFKSFMFEETDLLAGGGGGGSINGLSVALSTNTFLIESDATYGDTDTDGGDYPDPISNGPSAKVDISVVGASNFTTTGHDFSHGTSGDDPSNNTYKIDASNTTATTDSGVVLTTSLTGHDDEGPTDFTIDFKNASASNKVVMKIRVTLDSGNTRLTLNSLTQHVDDSTTALKSVTVNVPFKINVAGNISTVTRTFTVQKVRTGQEGNTARVVNMTSDKMAFVYDENGLNPTGNATITATALNTTGQVYFEFMKGNTQLSIGLGEADSDGIYSKELEYSPQANDSNMPEVIEVRIREQAGNATGTILARDTITLIGLRPGSGAFQVVLGNPAHTAPTTNDGTVTFTDSGPKFLAVFKGSTRLALKSGNTGTPGIGEYTVAVTTPSSIVTADTSPTLDTVGVGGGANKDCVFDDHTGLTGNVGTVVYAVNCENAQTVSAVQTVTRSNQGADGADGSDGTDSRAVNLTASRMAVAFDENGNLTSTTAITLTATAVNTTGTVYYDFQVNDSTVQNTDSSSDTLDVDGTSFSDYPKKIEVQIREGSNSGTVVARDQITIVGLKEGKDGYTVVVSNEAHTMPETTAGALTFTGSGTSVRVYKGTTELTAVASGATVGLNQFTVTSVSVANGNLSGIGAISVNTSATPDHILIADHSGTMSSDSVILTINVNIEGLSTVVKTQTLAKSKQGASGANALGVDIEVDPQVVVYAKSGGSPDVSSVRIDATSKGVGDPANALDFSGDYTSASDASHASIPDGSTGGLLDFGNSTNDVSFSFAFWFKPDAGGTSNTRYIFGKYTSPDGYYCIYGDENASAGAAYKGRLVLSLRDNSSSHFNAPDVTVNGVTKKFFTGEFGKWVHVGIVYTKDAGGNSEKIQFYKNGSPWGSAVVSPNDSYVAMHDNSERFRIGTLGSTASTLNRAKGLLSNFLVYRHDGVSSRGTTPLTDSDMETIHNSGLVHTNYKDSGMPKYQDLVCYWKLDETMAGSGNTTLADSSGGSRNLTTAGSSKITTDTNSGLLSRNGPIFHTFRVAGVVVGSVNQKLPYVNWTGVPSTFASFKGDPKTAIVETRVNNATDPIDGRDQSSIVAIKEGEGGLTFVLDNPFHPLNAATDGTVASNGYGGSGTNIQVFSGGTQLTVNSGTPAADDGTFKVTAVSAQGNRVVAGAITNTNGATAAVIADHAQATDSEDRFSASATSCTVTYTLNVEGKTRQTTQTISTSKQGAAGADGSNGSDGVSPPGVDLEIDPAAVAYDEDGANPSASSVNILATTRNLGTEIARSAKFGHANSTYARRFVVDNKFPSTQNAVIAFWIKFKDDETFTTNSHRYVIFSTEIRVSVHNDDLIFYHTVGGVGHTITDPQFFKSSDAGKWIHVTIGRYQSGYVFNTKNGNYTGGDGGTSDANGFNSGAANLSSIDVLNSVLYVGNISTNNSQKLDAELSNILFYDDYFGIGNGDRAKLYNSGKVHTNYLDNSLPHYDDLQLWYKLDEDQGTTSATSTTFADSSGRNMHLSSVATSVESITSPGLFAKSGPSFFTFKVAGTVVGSADQTINNVNWTSVPSTYTLFKSQPQTVTVEMKPNSTSESVSARDQATIVGLKEGTGGYSIVLSNSAHTIPATSAGVVTTLANTGTEIRVYKGINQLNTTSDTPAAGTNNFKVTSVTRSNNAIRGPSNGTYTNTEIEAMRPNGSNYYDFGDLTAWPDSHNGYLEFTIQVEGSSLSIRQTFTVASAGTDGAPGATGPQGPPGPGGSQGPTGPPGADAGIVVVVDKSTAIVQTDAFGNPLSGQLANTATLVSVYKNGTIQPLDTSLSINEHANPAQGKWHLFQDPNGQSETPHTEDGLPTGLGEGNTGTVTLWSDPSGGLYTRPNANQCSWRAPSALNTTSIFRTLTVAYNLGGTVYYPLAIQTIQKAVAQVDEIIPIIQKPTVILERTNWTAAEQPEIKDYSPAATYIKVFRQANGAQVALNTSTAADADMPNNTYKVEVGTANSAFPTINIQAGSRTHASTQVNIGNPSGYTNANYPEPAVIDYQVRYKDSVGKMHSYPVRQTIVPTTVYPPRDTAIFDLEIDFSDTHNTDTGFMEYMKSNPRTNGKKINVLDFTGGHTSGNNTSMVDLPASGGLIDFATNSGDVSFTFFFWIKLDTGGTSNTRYLFSKWKNSVEDGYYAYYGEENATTASRRGELKLLLRDGNVSNVFVSSGFFTGYYGEWTHVGISYSKATSGNNEKVRFYRNGLLVNTHVSPNDSYVKMDANDQRFRIGSLDHSISSATNLKGQVSNFIVLRHDGTNGRGTAAAGESGGPYVPSFYNKGGAHDNYNDLHDDIVYWWKLDESISGTTTQLTDYSGNNRHLQAKGSSHLNRVSNGFYLTVQQIRVIPRIRKFGGGGAVSLARMNPTATGYRKLEQDVMNPDEGNTHVERRDNISGLPSKRFGNITGTDNVNDFGYAFAYVTDNCQTRLTGVANGQAYWKTSPNTTAGFEMHMDIFYADADETNTGASRPGKYLGTPRIYVLAPVERLTNDSTAYVVDVQHATNASFGAAPDPAEGTGNMMYFSTSPFGLFGVFYFTGTLPTSGIFRYRVEVELYKITSDFT